MKNKTQYAHQESLRLKNEIQVQLAYREEIKKNVETLKQVNQSLKEQVHRTNVFKEKVQVKELLTVQH